MTQLSITTRGMLVLALLVATLATHGVNAGGREVYELAEKSVAFISTPEGTGSGVLVSDKGLVLTNRHVLSPVFAESVTLTVERAGALESMTFENVTVLGIHKTYDAALLRITIPPGVKVFPCKMNNPKTDVAKGDVVYAIGNPGGAGTILHKSITRGTVTDPTAHAQGMAFIESTTPINPGNSGGPLLNSRGHLIGLNTWKYSHQETMGFAVPMVAIADAGDFADPDRAERDPEAAAILAGDAGALIDRARLARDPDVRMALLERAALLLRLAVGLNPEPHGYYLILGQIHAYSGNVELAEAYFKEALRRQPEDPDVILSVAVFRADNGRRDEAMKLLGGLVRNAAKPEHAAAALATIAGWAYESDVDLTAAYYAAWALSLDAANEDARAVLDDCRPILGSAHLEHLAGRIADGVFSQEDRRTFESMDGGLIAGGGEAVQATTAIVNFETRKLEKKEVLQYADADADEGKRNLIPLDVALAYGYRYLVVNLGHSMRLQAKVIPTNRSNGPARIEVYDLSDRRLRHQWDLPTEHQFMAAGGKRVVALALKSKTFRIWELDHFAMEREFTLDVDGLVGNLYMAPENGRVCAFWWLEEKQDPTIPHRIHSRLRAGIIDLDSGTWYALPIDFDVSTSGDIHLTSDPKMDTLYLIPNKENNRPGEMIVSRLAIPAVLRSKNLQPEVVTLAIGRSCRGIFASANGQYLISDAGEIFSTTDGALMMEMEPFWRLVPVHADDAVALAIREKNVDSKYLDADLRPVDASSKRDLKNAYYSVFRGFRGMLTQAERRWFIGALDLSLSIDGNGVVFLPLHRKK